ncbi:uncharacterized protein si:ch211-191i18.2 isoform X1 [Trichomycterus rosablanca]|uniref:uncharacterized protein si:ch211-191i18.2 isoform X1 n=1 Tax=Trichomycterus rosablanca TaxID=2290929 RepID=UPI002F35A309
MPLCCDVIEVVSEYDSYYDSTAAPDYDYNSTFLYSFFSNGSSEDWDIFIREKESETETGELDIEPTVSNNNQNTIGHNVHQTGHYHARTHGTQRRQTWGTTRVLAN